MFGLDLLITPVLEQRADDRSVYLPAGTEWTDARTGVGQVGGTEATTDTPLERMTMLLREAPRSTSPPSTRKVDFDHPIRRLEAVREER